MPFYFNYAMIHVCASCPWWSQGDLSCLIGLIQTQPVRRRPSRHWGLTAGAENGWARLCQDAKVPADGHRALRVLKCLVNILAAINPPQTKLIVFWHTHRHRVSHRHAESHTDTQSLTQTRRVSHRHAESHTDTQSLTQYTQSLTQTRRVSHRHAESHTDTQSLTQTRRVSHRHAESHTDTQSLTQTHRVSHTHTHRVSHRVSHTHTHTESHTHTQSLTQTQSLTHTHKGDPFIRFFLSKIWFGFLKICQWGSFFIKWA